MRRVEGVGERTCRCEGGDDDGEEEDDGGAHGEGFLFAMMW